MKSVDANTLARLAGVPLPTFNAWVMRGLLPGVETGTKGKARQVDYKTGLRVTVMAELVTLGYSPAFAAMAAAEAERIVGIDTPGARLIIGPPQKNVYGLGVTPTIDCTTVKDIKDLDSFLNAFRHGRPTTFTVVELDRLASRVKAVFNPPAAKRVEKPVARRMGALVDA